jgi:hypothetical protein
MPGEKTSQEPSDGAGRHHSLVGQVADQLVTLGVGEDLGVSGHGGDTLRSAIAEIDGAER